MRKPIPARGGRRLRCAIATRKSPEEGLEQEFNSLHAQREACEAFITSQRHEGWVCLPQHYDDGGLSGATMDRPALQQLLAAERIRDKIAASKKKKGLWMGGVPPLGYAARDHRLVVVDTKAEIVRYIFRRYTALGSVRLLQEELAAQGITSRRWTSAAGGTGGGKPLARGALYLMLQNRIYRGEIVHKRQSHPGEYQPIIEPALWDRVQTQLAANTVERSTGTRSRRPSLLAGLLAILDGRQPRDLTAEQLLDHSRLPLTWPEQRRALGFT